MSKDLLVLADEYAAATATFARALALKDSADSMSPIAREAGDKRAVLAEALAALDTAQQEPVNAMLVEALERMVESVTGVDQVSAVNEARAALTAAKQAQPEPSDLRGIDACPVAEWVDLVKRGYVSRDECLIAVKDIPLWIAKNSEQAQPERAPLSDEEIEQAVKTHGVSWTGYREDKHGFYTIPILLPYHYQFARAIEAAIKQGGQHD